MLTIYTSPKPFKGHSGVIQRNAIKSWTLLKPTPQIIIFGDEEGNAEICAELNITHVPKVELSGAGTPLISSMFGLAQQLSPNPLLCYANADIMLTSDFIKGLRVASAAKDQFVMTGRRTQLEMEKFWDFDQPDWEGALRKYAQKDGVLDQWMMMDYFAFPRSVYTKVPPFVVGRARWDNWMIYSALQRDIPVIDATRDILAVHQNHDYKHLKGGLKDCFVSPEGQNNQNLYGLQTCIGIIDATYMLKNGRVQRSLERTYLSRRFDTLNIFHPTLARVAWPVLAARDLARLVRQKLSGKPAEAPAAF